MSNNKTKKIVLKTYKKTANKYLGTDDQIEEKVISENIINSSKKKKDNKNTNQIIQTNNLNKNLTEQTEEETELLEELNSLKTKYESEKLETMQNVQIINNEIIEKNRQLKFLTKENYKLILSLKDMGKNLKGEFLKIYNEKMKKRNILNNIEETLKYGIIIKEEEIKNAKKMANEERRQALKCEERLNEINNGMEQNLVNDLKELNDNIKILSEEIEELSICKSIHKNCEKNKQYLKNKLNLFKTEVEFESKKNNMLINKSVEPSNKLNMSSSISKNNLLLSENKESIYRKNNYSQKIRIGILKKNIPKPEKLNISTYRYVTNNFNLIKTSPNKKILIDKSYNNSNLFTDKEHDFLREIIPSKYMNRYINEFESRKKQKEEIENKFEEHNNIKDKKQQIQFRIDYIGIKIKEEEKKHLELLLKFRNNNRIKKELKNKLEKYEKEIKNLNKNIERHEKLRKIFEKEKL